MARLQVEVKRDEARAPPGNLRTPHASGLGWPARVCFGCCLACGWWPERPSASSVAKNLSMTSQVSNATGKYVATIKARSSTIRFIPGVTKNIKHLLPAELPWPESPRPRGCLQTTHPSHHSRRRSAIGQKYQYQQTVGTASYVICY